MTQGELGEPFTLFGEHCGMVGCGWTNIGYHSNNTNFNFNNYANKVQLQQQWLWAQKAADGSEGLGLGGRIDYLYVPMRQILNHSASPMTTGITAGKQPEQDALVMAKRFHNCIWKSLMATRR